MKHYFDNGEREESFRYPKSIVCSPHVHPLVESVFVTDGSIVATVDGQNYTVNAGEAIVIPPNHIHGYIDQTNQHLCILVFPLEDYPELENIQRMESPIVKDIVTPELQIFLQSAFVLYNLPNSTKTIKHGIISTILGVALSKSELYLDNNPTNVRGMEIYDYCIKNYRNEISRKDVANALNISEGHVSLLFSKKFNVSFNDYINMLRINDAKQLLAGTDRSITAIATECGFNTVRSFNRAFLKQVGTTPLNYRKIETQRKYLS